MASDWTPDQPLRADATDAQMYVRARALFMDGASASETATAWGAAYGATAREFAAACVAAERNQAIRDSLQNDRVHGNVLDVKARLAYAEAEVARYRSLYQIADGDFAATLERLDKTVAMMAAAKREVERMRSALTMVQQDGCAYSPCCEEGGMDRCSVAIARAALASPSTEAIDGE